MPIDVSKLNLQLVPVTTTISVSGGASREAAGGTCYRSGRLVLNASGSEAWMNLVNDLTPELGPDLNKTGTSFEADVTNKVVTARPVIGAGQGIMPFRVSADGKTVSLHLGGVFAQQPKLRVAGTRTVSVAVAPDGKGKNCLLIFLQIALAKAKTPSAKDGQSKNGKAKADKAKTDKTKAGKDKADKDKADKAKADKTASDKATDDQPAISEQSTTQNTQQENSDE